MRIVSNLRGFIFIYFRNDKESSAKANSLFQMYIPRAGFSMVHVSAGYLMSERARNDYCCKEEDDFLQMNNLLSVFFIFKDYTQIPLPSTPF